MSSSKSNGGHSGLTGGPQPTMNHFPGGKREHNNYNSPNRIHQIRHHEDEVDHQVATSAGHHHLTDIQLTNYDSNPRKNHHHHHHHHKNKDQTGSGSNANAHKDHHPGRPVLNNHQLDSLGGSLSTFSEDSCTSDDPNAPTKHDFMVSFLVDARGGCLLGCRHSGVKVRIIQFKPT